MTPSRELIAKFGGAQRAAAAVRAQGAAEELLKDGIMAVRAGTRRDPTVRDPIGWDSTTWEDPNGWDSIDRDRGTPIHREETASAASARPHLRAASHPWLKRAAPLPVVDPYLVGTRAAPHPRLTLIWQAFERHPNVVMLHKVSTVAPSYSPSTE
jgi:hypothetical protein